MGNWRTVMLTGTVDEADLPALRAAVEVDLMHWTEGQPPPGPLSYDRNMLGLGGLGIWPAATIQAAGNLFERDYTPDDVAGQLRTIVGIVPSLRLTVHCGDDYERPECVATVSVAGGQVTIGDPQVRLVHGVSDAEAMGRLLDHLTRPAG